MLEAISNNIGAFLTILGAIATLIWHLITQYFDYRKHKEHYADQCNMVKEHDKTIDKLESLIENFIAGCDGRESVLEARILVKVAEQEKAILLKVIDQETRNSQEYNAMTKVFGQIEKQLSLLTTGIDNQKGDIKNISSRIESMERDRLEELKERISELKTRHNQ